MNKILIVDASDSDSRLMSGLSHRHSCPRHFGVKIIISGSVPDFPFTFLSMSGADIETGEIDRKYMGYSHDSIRCIVLLTERERTYTSLLRGLLIYPADNIL